MKPHSLVLLLHCFTASWDVCRWQLPSLLYPSSGDPQTQQWLQTDTGAVKQQVWCLNPPGTLGIGGIHQESMGDGKVPPCVLHPKGGAQLDIRKPCDKISCWEVQVTLEVLKP